MPKSETAAWMHAFNCYPLAEEMLPVCVDIENPAKDYHPALNMVYQDQTAPVWVLPFILKKGHALIIPLWVPAIFESGRFRVDKNRLKPWLPSVLTDASCAHTPWVGAHFHLAQLYTTFERTWQEDLPAWGEFYHRSLLMLEECAKAPWHDFFKRNGYERLPAKLVFAAELEKIIPNLDTELQINQPSAHNPHWLNLCGKSKGKISQHDQALLLKSVSLKAGQLHAIHSRPEQYKPFLQHFIATKVVQAAAFEQPLGVNIYQSNAISHDVLPTFVESDNDDFAKDYSEFKEGAELLGAFCQSGNALDEFKAKIKGCQDKDKNLEQELKNWQDILKKCDESIPATWSEKIKYFHIKRNRARDAFIANLGQQLHYADLPKKIRELKVKRHKTHHKIMQLAENQCKIEANAQRFFNWCAKHHIPYDKDTKPGIAHFDAILHTFAPSLTSKALKILPDSNPTTSEGLLSDNMYCIAKQNDELLLSKGITENHTLVILDAHRMSLDMLSICQAQFEHIILLGDFFAHAATMPYCSDEQLSALQYAVADWQEMPLKRQYQQIEKLEFANHQSEFLAKLTENLLLLTPDLSLQNEDALAFVHVQGKSNIGNLHYCNIPEAQAIQRFVLKQLEQGVKDIAVVTLFYEQMIMLKTILPQINVYTIANMPDKLFDTIVYSTVYDINDKRPFAHDEGPDAFYRAALHAKNKLVIVGDRRLYNANMNTISACMAKYLDHYAPYRINESTPL